MKSGALSVHWRGLVRADFGRVFFCHVSNARFHRFPVGKIFTKFEHNTSIAKAMQTFGTEFWQFYRKGSFKQTQTFLKFFNVLRLQTSITLHWLYRRKFTTKLTLFGMSSLHFYRRNQFSLRSVQETYSQIFRTRWMRVTHGNNQFDTFVITRWRHELHTAHYTEGPAIISFKIPENNCTKMTLFTRNL